MKCPDCGRESPADSLFCPHCGRRLNGASVAEDRPAGGSSAGRDDPSASEEPAQKLARAAAGATAEEELWAGRYSLKAMAGTWFVAALIALGLLALGIAIGKPNVWLLVVAAIVLEGAAVAVIGLVRRYGIRYRLTTQRFIQERGLLARTTNRIQTIDIDDITVEQGVFDRFLGTGLIKVVSSDRTDPTLLMPGIEDVAQVADLMDNVRRAERRRRGLRIESIQADGGDMHGHHG